MLAAVVKKPGELVIEQTKRPVPDPRQFIIKTLAASICNATDNHIVEGIYDGYHDHYPQVLGHEICGEVVELGSEVTDVKLGERIAMYTPHGAFQEYVPVDRDGYGFARVPDNISNEAASICEMQAFEMVSGGKIPIEKLITHKITLDQLPWALDMCHNHLDECIKFIVYPRFEQ